MEKGVMDEEEGGGGEEEEEEEEEEEVEKEKGGKDLAGDGWMASSFLIKQTRVYSTRLWRRAAQAVRGFLCRSVAMDGGGTGS